MWHHNDVTLVRRYLTKLNFTFVTFTKEGDRPLIPGPELRHLGVTLVSVHIILRAHLASLHWGRELHSEARGGVGGPRPVEQKIEIKQNY